MVSDRKLAVPRASHTSRSRPCFLVRVQGVVTTVTDVCTQPLKVCEMNKETHFTVYESLMR